MVVNFWDILLSFLSLGVVEGVAELAGDSGNARAAGRSESTRTHCLGAALLEFLGQVRELERLATEDADRDFYYDQAYRVAMWMVDLHQGSPAEFVANTIVKSRDLVMQSWPNEHGYVLASRQLQARARRIMQLKG